MKSGLCHGFWRKLFGCFNGFEGKEFSIFSYYVFTDYIEQAMLSAEYSRLEDGSIAGLIPVCQGVIAFGAEQDQCREDLQRSLEAWILMRLKLGHALPIIHGINLNQEPYYA